jgi:hypothetical protein
MIYDNLININKYKSNFYIIVGINQYLLFWRKAAFFL